jgi:hypothetical protein
MKAMLYAQLNPRKTMRQLIEDRDLFRLAMCCSVLLVWFL